MQHRLIAFSIRHPRLVFTLVAATVILLGAQIPRVVVDTDPENMLPQDNPARVFHDHMKESFSMHDAIVVGLVDETHPQGVFTPQTLAHVIALTERIKAMEGVVAEDVLSLATVDNVTADGPGVVRFEWLLAQPPTNDAAALAVRDAALRIPMFAETLLSRDGRATAIYVPIIDKSYSYRLERQIQSAVNELGIAQTGVGVYVTGLTVAEDTFGVEMFKQMAISAPAAALVIFFMLWLFFRSPALIASPMLMAIAVVIATMGLLIGLGFPVHIMSSMIPIFLMPIAVVDSVHLLSEFSDRYPNVGDAQKTIAEVTGELFTPMLYTSLTSIAGFASLALTPIPPVRVFGVFVAFGIALAFLLTITFIPAYVASLKPARLAKLAAFRTGDVNHSPITRSLAWMGGAITRYGKVFVAAAVVVAAISAYGISRIQINDNPVRWFVEDHRIREADRVLNRHFAGTYMAHLVLHQDDDGPALAALAAGVDAALATALANGVDLSADWQAIVDNAPTEPLQARLEAMMLGIDEAMFAADAATLPYWERLMDAIAAAQREAKYFQTPQALAYLERLQTYLDESSQVGKTSSLVDIVKTVHRELYEGDPAAFRLPDTIGGVAQTLLSYQSSHRPNDLWHMVTPDMRSANVWLQLRSGDNRDMAAVVAAVDAFTAANPPPVGLKLDWGGLTYLNVVWQQEMVTGMVESLVGSFVVVLVMMVFLFRSLWFGVLSMIPLSLTIAFIYGLIGLVGKDYDMPIAVLSSLTLGLSIDFAIHFLERLREVYAHERNWGYALKHMFEEPGRAIVRNAVVIATGFLPLLMAPLVPYNTVGIFMFLIMAVSSMVTMILLPSVVELFHGRLFPQPAGDLIAANRTAGGAPMKTVMLLLLGIALGAAVLGPQAAAAADLVHVDEIVHRANLAAYYAGQDGRAQVRLKIVDGPGRERSRIFTILRRDVTDGGDQHYLVVFSQPADVRNTVFLVAKHARGDDDRWLYLPGLDLVKRIAAGDKRTSFVGSHFFYEDVSGRNPAADVHELVATDERFYTLRSTPKAPDSVEFAFYTMKIDKTTFLPHTIEYTDKNGRVYRRVVNEAVETIQGYPTVTRARIDDVASAGYTVVEFRGVTYDLGIPESVFAERSLRNPPMEWLRGR